MKPPAATSKGWREWDKEAKAAHPIRYWIVEEGLDRIQHIIYWPTDRIYDVKYWFNNRYITKTHAMTSNLRKGEWHEYETRLLHSMFDELVNFVEVELAWSHILWDDGAAKKYKAPFYARGWFRTRTWRCPEAGLANLEWASTLTDEDFLPEEEKHKAKPTPQAKTAKEVLELYHWWKEVYPNRPDPHDASGWSDLCDRRRESGEGFGWEDYTPEERKETSKILKLTQKIEEQYYKEDERMMIRLIKIRRGLWT
jgi:hypothetical protein